MTHALTRALRDGLEAAADADRAPAMQRYMKSAEPFWGVPASVSTPIFRAAITSHRCADRQTWVAVIRDLYDQASHREERYAALAVLKHRSYALWCDAEALPVFEHLIVTGAWWDLVDDASATAGDVLHRDRAKATAIIRRWATADDLWLRRAAIICQRKQRDQTDVSLLAHAIEHSTHDPDFFARKAIGWHCGSTPRLTLTGCVRS